MALNCMSVLRYAVLCLCLCTLCQSPFTMMAKTWTYKSWMADRFALTGKKGK